MRKISLSILSVCALSLLMVGGAFAKDKTPPGSFLKYRATTVAELTSQVSKDATIKSLYAKHFGVSASQVTAYFNENLKLVTLKSPRKVQTWYVDKDGKQVSRAKLLPKGTLVFASKEGTPMLAWSCGNPLRASLPPKMIAKATKEPITAIAGMTEEVGLEGAAEAAVAPETLVLANPVETIAAAAVTAPPGFIAQTLPALVPAVQVAAVPMIGAAALPAIGGAAGGIGALGVIGGLSAVAGGLALAGGGGSNPSPPPVPEPTGLITIMIGLTSLAPAVRQMVKRN